MGAHAWGGDVRWSDKDGWCREYVRSYTGATGRTGPHRVWAPTLKAAMERTLTGEVFAKGIETRTKIRCVASGEHVVFKWDHSSNHWAQVEDTFRDGAR